MEIYMEEKQANSGKGGNSVKTQGCICKRIQHTWKALRLSASDTLGHFPYKDKAVIQK